MRAAGGPTLVTERVIPCRAVNVCTLAAKPEAMNRAQMHDCDNHLALLRFPYVVGQGVTPLGTRGRSGCVKDRA